MHYDFIEVPAGGEAITVKCDVSNEDDVKIAVQAAIKAQAAWADITPVQRGDMLHDITLAMRNNREEIATIVAAETGMSYNAALGETNGAIAQDAAQLAEMWLESDDQWPGTWSQGVDITPEMIERARARVERDGHPGVRQALCRAPPEVQELAIPLVQGRVTRAQLDAA